MIRLLGVVHGGMETDFLLQKRQVELRPTREFEEVLRSLPVKTRVGVELLSPGDWSEVEGHLRMLSLESGVRVRYDHSSDRYFEWVRGICESCGHEVVPIEDKQAWLRYNPTLIDLGRKVERQNVVLEREQFLGSEWSFEKHVVVNEEVRIAEVLSKKVQLLERDEAMLRNIASTGVGVVVAGKGHTDMWVLNRNEIERMYGIRFGQYSTDDIAIPKDFRLGFVEHAVPDPSESLEFVLLRRALSLLEKGRFSDEIPYWVGTWDVHNPSLGYFELFVEEETPEGARGRIEDMLGTAVCNGVITPRQVKFVKKYVNCAEGAATSNITFESKRTPHETDKHRGIFVDEYGKRNFYMERWRGSSPLEMALSWHELCNTNRRKSSHAVKRK